MMKSDFGVSYEVRHKPGCKVTEDDKRLQISDLLRELYTMFVVKINFKALISEAL